MSLEIGLKNEGQVVLLIDFGEYYKIGWRRFQQILTSKAIRGYIYVFTERQHFSIIHF